MGQAMCALEVPDCIDMLVLVNDEGGEIEPDFEVEHEYRVQSYEDAVKQDCALAGGLLWVTSDGEVGCVPQDLKDSGEELGSPSQPPTIEPLLVPAPAT